MYSCISGEIPNFDASRFRGNLVSRKWLKNAKTRNFLLVRVCTNKVYTISYSAADGCCIAVSSKYVYITQ